MLNRELSVAPTAPSRSFVSFVHMSVTVQGLLITGTGLVLLLADLRTGALDAPAQDWLLLLPALLAALYLMVSEKILRDRLVLQKVRDAAYTAAGLERAAKVGTLSELFVRTRTFYHFLMLACFLLYAGSRLTGAAGRSAVFHLEWGLIAALYCELVACTLRLWLAYGRTIVDDLARTLGPSDEGRADALVYSVRKHLGLLAGGGTRPVLGLLGVLKIVAAAAAAACVVAPLFGLSVPFGFGPRDARWIADGTIVVLGLTFSWFNVKRERFLLFARELCGRLEAQRS